MTKISPGDRFGHWTVLAPSKERPYYFTCRCDCGTVKDVYRSSLLQGTSTQCPACAFSAISDGPSPLRPGKGRSRPSCSPAALHGPDRQRLANP